MKFYITDEINSGELKNSQKSKFNFDKDIYEDLKDVNLVAQALNTSPEIMKSNYLNYSDKWARNRFRLLGYDKRALPQSLMKFKNKVSGK